MYENEKFDDIEYGLTKMIKPLEAIRLLFCFLMEYIYEETFAISHSNQQEKDRNIEAIVYTISLLQAKLKTLRQECYDRLY